MTAPYEDWKLVPAQPAAPDISNWTLVPAGADWVAGRRAELDALDKRLAESVGPARPNVATGDLGSIGHGLQMGITRGWEPKIEAAVTAGLGKIAGEGDFSDIYQAELEKNRAAGEELRRANPKEHFVADLIGGSPGMMFGGPVVGSALSGGARAAGESENIAGEKGTNLRGAAETAGGAALSGATAWALPKLFSVIAGNRAKAADEAAKQAVTFGTQTARDKFERALEPVARMAPGGEMVPGETATMLQKAGAVGGFRGQRATLKGIQSAKDAIGHEFGDILGEASGHPGVPISSAETHLQDAIVRNQANDYVEKEAAKALETLKRLQGKDGFISHSALQEKLANMNLTATGIFKKKNWTEHDAAFVSVYNALRGLQDEGLQAATGRNAQDIRKYMAMFYGLEPVAEKAVNRFEGNDKIGLLGELKKSRGWTSMGHGVLALATGHPVLGGSLMAKGAKDVASGHLGKATAPLRNNLATSIDLGMMRGARGLALPQMGALYGRYSAPYGAQGGGLLYDKYAPGEAPPEEEPIPQEVARRVLVQTLRGR